MFTSISNAGIAVRQIPLNIRRCFVRSMLLLTRYPQLGGKQTEGTYNSLIVNTYKCDRIPDAWYEPDAVIKMCRLFALPNSAAREIQNLLTKVDLKIDKQQKIIDALINNFDRLNTQKDVLNLFQALFGNIPIPEASINCLTTKMQIAFIVDYQEDRLKSQSLWCDLSEIEQQQVSQFLTRISQFGFQQFANFPSFTPLNMQNNPGLWRYLTEVTGYSQTEIIRAIASSVNIVSAERAESFLLHDIWGHYWQSMLTRFDSEYLYLSKVDETLGLDSSINNGKETICLRELFKLHNQSICIDVPRAKQFFYFMATERIAALSTHLIGEMLADINEYKWLSNNRDSQDMRQHNPQALLNSSSSYPNFPTKLDLTIKDWNFLYLPTLLSLIKLSPALEADLIDYFEIKNNDLYKLRTALSNLEHIFMAEYINYDRLRLTSNCAEAYPSSHNFSSLILSLTKLQNILNKLYTMPINLDLLPFQDLILLFVGNYYSPEFEQDITQVNFALTNFFYPCWQLLALANV